ncbi:hypothetical protein BGZ49_006377, partial [Haplosporangium sp. Z 27]
TEELICYSGYTIENLEPAIEDIVWFLKMPKIQLTPAYRKYSSKVYGGISTFVYNTINSH